MAADRSVARLKSVVFDVGNVLVDWNPRAFFQRHIVDPARLDRFLGEVATLEWHTQHDAGRSFADTSAELIALHPDEAEHIRLWGERFDEQIGDWLPGMASESLSRAISSVMRSSRMDVRRILPLSKAAEMRIVISP